MEISHRIELLLALPLLPCLGYVCIYLALRLVGVLRVNAEGWHAGGVHLGRRILVPALRLFAAFQPLMRRESAVARRLFGRSRKRDQAVSDVVVELVPIA